MDGSKPVLDERGMLSMRMELELVSLCSIFFIFLCFKVLEIISFSNRFIDCLESPPP